MAGIRILWRCKKKKALVGKKWVENELAVQVSGVGLAREFLSVLKMGIL